MGLALVSKVEDQCMGSPTSRVGGPAASRGVENGLFTLLRASRRSIATN